MKKNTRSKLETAAKFLTVFTIVFTVLEGWYFYSGQKDILLRCLLIFQNTFQAFLLRSTISLSSAIGSLPPDPPLFRRLVVYGYAISQVAAPVLTAAALYRTIELFFRRYRRDRTPKSGEPVLVYGYNAFARRMLLSAHQLGYRPYLIPGRKLTDDEELELLKHRIGIIQKIEETKLDLPQIRHVVLADEDIAADLSAFLSLQEKELSLPLNDDCRFYIYYDDPGDRWLSEKVYMKAVEDEALKVTNFTDIEFFDLSEIAARKATDRVPLHGYQDCYGWDHRDFHMLIVGFGQMGQQLFMKALNQGVFCSGGRMIIDIIDHHARENSSLFFKQFRCEVERPSDLEFRLASPLSDGVLDIRLHEVDARFQEFKDCLASLSTPEDPFTYGVICLNDNAASIQALNGLQDIIRDLDYQKEFPVVIRLTGEAKDNLFRQIENAISMTYCIPYEKTNVTLDDIFRNETELEARKYNWIYNRISFRDGTDAAPAGEPVPSESAENAGAAEAAKGAENADLADTVTDTAAEKLNSVTVSEEELRRDWLSMRVFQRDSSRALYDHKPVKDRLLSDATVWQEMQEAIGPQGKLLSRSGNIFYMEGGDSDFLARLEGEPVIRELMMTEHRRWDYYMISQGWRWARVKNMDNKENPCLTDWEHLLQLKPDTCKYDLIPYLLYDEKPADRKEE